jgi:hypothetical protein
VAGKWLLLLLLPLLVLVRGLAPPPVRAVASRSTSVLERVRVLFLFVCMYHCKK